jgi:nucleotidyltransferase substrate binding protein (TIGR01987 family)
MERLNAQQENLAKSLKSLNAAIEGYCHAKQNNSREDLILEVFQDSVVKRFEISFDLLWKYLKEFLFVYHGIEVVSPKKVFKEALTQQLINHTELETFLAMCDDRNLTAHTYDRDHAQEVAETVLGYYFVIKPALVRILQQKG